MERILAEDRVVYGVTTGFGLLATTRIPLDQVRKLQLNLIRSHAVGVGEPLPRDVVRAAMLLRTSTIAKGYSGVRTEVLETLCELLNADLVPWVPSRGSLGAVGRPRPLGPPRAGHDGRGRVPHGAGANACRPVRCSTPPASRRSRSRPKKASRC